MTNELNIGDLVEIKSAIKDDKIIGFIHTISDGKVGVRWFQNNDNRSTPYAISSLEKYVSDR